MSSFNFSRPLASALVTEGWSHPRTGRKHESLDIRAPVGTPIYAMSPGTVQFAGQYSDGSGGAVELNHRNGVFTRYLHLSRIDVQNGQSVNTGQRIGATGFATSPHAHIDSWADSRALANYVMSFGTPKGGFDQTKNWGGIVYTKVPSEPIVPVDQYQKDVIDGAKASGIPLYSPYRRLIAIALVGAGAFFAYQVVKASRS